MVFRLSVIQYKGDSSLTYLQISLYYLAEKRGHNIVFLLYTRIKVLFLIKYTIN